MARLKRYLSGYRPVTLACGADTENARIGRELAYKMWLLGREAKHVGLYTSERELKAWREWIEENRTPEFDATLARQSEDAADLERRASKACERAGELLSERGFGMFIYFSEPYFNPERSDTPVPFMSRAHGYYTDGERFVYIGTQRARGYIAQERKPLQIIIEPGRAPDDSELLALIEAILPQQQLDLAA